MLLDNFEFLTHVDDWIENQQIEELVDRIKPTDFVAKVISSSRNMKLLVTSSESVVFSSLAWGRSPWMPLSQSKLFTS